MAADNATLSSEGFSQWKPMLQPLEYTVDQTPGIHVLRFCLPLLNYVQRLCDKACRPQNLKTAPDTAAPLVADGLKN